VKPTPDSRWLSIRRKLLWVDCSAGAIVGVTVLLLHGWLSKWYGLPQNLVLFMGVANLAYASYSFSLALRKKRPLALIRLLVIANLAWALLLLIWVVVFNGTASPLGLAYLVMEALFVGGLGILEWGSRGLLTTD